MLMALRFEPSRFFLKGKVRQKKQATFINTLKEGKLVRCEINTKEDSGSKRIRPLTFILHLYYRLFRLVSSLQQLILRVHLYNNEKTA